MAKRAFDILFSFSALLLLSPVLVILWILVKLNSPGPALYRATRVGKAGSVFSMVKFRSMIVGADQCGPLVTAGGDARITTLGRFLRWSKLDELPTFWNVLKGEMSIVGPRPENPISAQLYTEEQRRLWSVRPGVTSLASIKYRNEEALLAGAANIDARYFELLRDKLRLELDYIERSSFLLDLSIIVQTVIVIFYRKGHNA